MYVNPNDNVKPTPIQRIQKDVDDSDNEQEKETTKSQKISKIPIPVAATKNINRDEEATQKQTYTAINLFTSGIKSSLLTSTPKSPRFQAPILRDNQETNDFEQEHNNNLPKRRSIPTKRKLEYMNTIGETTERVDTHAVISQQQLTSEYEVPLIENVEVNNNRLDESEDDPSKYKLNIKKSNNDNKNKEKENVNNRSSRESTSNSTKEIKNKKAIDKILQPINEVEENQNNINIKEKTIEKSKPKAKSKPKPKNTNKIVQDEILNGPRRSKRVRVDPKTEEAVYKFENLNGIIVSSLVATTKKKFVPTEVLHQAYKTKTRNKKNKKSITIKPSKHDTKKSRQVDSEKMKSHLNKKAKQTSISNESLEMKIRPNQSINTSQETVCLEYDNNDENDNENEIRLYTFSKNNVERDYIECTDGISLAALSDKEALMRIDPKAATITNKHEFWTTYFVQEGECLLSLNGNRTKHAKADIFIVPKGKLLINSLHF